MSEFVKKAALGYKSVPGGYSDPDLTHVILTKAEYDSLLDELEAVKKEASDTAYRSDQKVASIRSQANEQIRETKADTDKATKKLQEELAADCSMCVRTYRAIEHGTSDAKVSQLYAIAKCLGTTLPDLLR